MLRLFGETHLNFMGYRRWAYPVSAALIIISIISLVYHGGPRYSVDFTGGTIIQVRPEPNLPPDVIRQALATTPFAGAEIQSIGQEGGYLIRLGLSEEGTDPFPIIRDAIAEAVPGTQVDLRREERVGPKIGRELRGRAIWAVLLSLAGILIYVGWRYEFTLALGAVAALFHDVFITIGFFSVLNKEISLTIVAALLTIAGFSINDTIVVFDRIREQSRLLRREKFGDIINLSVNQTLSRTVLTSLTVLITALALFFFGGEVIHDFAFAICVGVFVGTYSSIYVASALALDIGGSEKRRVRK